MLSEPLTTTAAAIAERLVARGESVAIAEVTSGGLVSAALLSVPGASAYYRGGFVMYTREMRPALAGATDLDPGPRGACEQYARYLAAGVAAKLAADWGIGETGATGPAGNPYGDDPGFTWIAVAGPDGSLVAQRLETGSADREANMQAFAAASLGALLAALD